MSKWKIEQSDDGEWAVWCRIWHGYSEEVYETRFPSGAEAIAAFAAGGR